MTTDGFGDLSDWGRVLKLLQTFAASGHLDKHQRGLGRILRYEGNSRLREAVLRSFENLRAPSHELVSEVLRILADKDSYTDLRLLAADALGLLADKYRDDPESQSGETVYLLLARVSDISAVPDLPRVQEAICRTLTRIENALAVQIAV
jgi:hypothetical protein